MCVGKGLLLPLSPLLQVSKSAYIRIPSHYSLIFQCGTNKKGNFGPKMM